MIKQKRFCDVSGKDIIKEAFSKISAFLHLALTGACQSQPPLPPHSLTRVQDFVTDLARASKGFLQIKKNSGNGLWGQGPEEDGNLCHLEKS
jgi:hypothetical protein